jgi:hypothetical protein
MLRSETIGKLATALAKAQGTMDDASKDSTNPHFRSKYADLASVRAAVRGPLSANGLAYVQLPSFDGECVRVETVLMHGESGEFLSETLSIPLLKKDAHSIGSAITYARRFSLMAVLGIAPDEDDDGNKASERPAISQRAAPRFAPPKVDTQPIDDETPHMEARAEAGASDPIANTGGASVPAPTPRKTVYDIPTTEPVAASRPHSLSISDTLIKRCRALNKEALGKKVTSLEAEKKLEYWKADARQLWLDMMPIDQRRADAERIKLEATIKQMQAAEAKTSYMEGIDEPINADTGEILEPAQ